MVDDCPLHGKEAQLDALQFHPIHLNIGDEMTKRLLLKLDILALGVKYWTSERRSAYNVLVRAIKKLSTKGKK